MNSRWALLLIVFSIFIFGCTQGEDKAKEQVQTKLTLCPDEKTLVSNTSLCPKVDTELLACEKAGGSAYGESPKDGCYYNLAIKRKNSSICVLIDNTLPYGKSKANCVGELALTSSNPELCTELVGSDRDVCYNFYAFQTLDAKVCDKISTAGLRDDCYSKLVFDLKDPQICQKIESRLAKDDCYYTIAVSSHKSEYCDQIVSSGTVYSKESCYASLGKYESYPEICDRLAKNSSIDNCYYAYAVLYPPEKEICERIKGAILKEKCMRDVNLGY